MMEQNPRRMHVMKSTSTNMEKIRSPRSPLPKNYMPKSPVPESPIAYERFKSKCTYSLISFFNFHQKHSDKLISNKKRRTVGEECTDGLKLYPQIDEKYRFSRDTKKRNATTKVHNTKRNSDPVTEPRGRRKSSKNSQRPSRFGCYNVDTMGQNMVGRSDKLDTAVTSQASFSQVSQVNEINLRVSVDAATEAFINQEFADGGHRGDDGGNCRSKHFLDALEVLNSNKDVFIKLLKDPNSLLVKHIESLRENQSEKQLAVSSTDTDNPQAEEEIVILRPGRGKLQNYEDRNSHDSSQANRSLKNVRHSVKPTFSPLKCMKRKLMRAMRAGKREQELMLTNLSSRLKTVELHQRGKHGEEAGIDSVDQNTSVRGEISISSVNDKDLSDKSRNSAELAGLASRSYLGESNSSSCSLSKGDIYQLLSERKIKLPLLSEKNVDILRKERLTSRDSLNRDLHRKASPRNKGGASTTTQQMRFSSCSSCQSMDDNSLRKRVNDENLSIVEAFAMVNESQTEANTLDNIVYNADSLDQDDDLHVRGNLDSRETKSNGSGESNLEPSYEPHRSSVQEADNRHINSVMVDNESLYISTPTSPSSAGTSSCSQSSIRGIEDFDRTMEGAEQPSPVSVLELFINDDTTSPLSTLSLPAEKVVLPDHDTSVTDRDTVFEYIMAILQSSSLDWDELSFRWHSVNQILDKSLFDKLNSCPSHSSVNRLNPGIYFDYFNEVLEELYQHHLRCSPWLSFIKPEVRLIAKANRKMHETIKSVNWNLIQHSPWTLGQNIEKDLAKSTTWMDIRIDAYETVSELTETILQELMTTEFAVG